MQWNFAHQGTLTGKCILTSTEYIEAVNMFYSVTYIESYFHFDQEDFKQSDTVDSVIF